MFQVPTPVNEPVLAHAPGSKERAALDAEVKRLLESPTDVPLHIGGEAVRTSETKPFTCPHRHATKLGHNALAGEAELKAAVQAAMDARAGWAAMDFHARAAVFLRAADLLAGPWRQRLNAATALNQSKTPHQAEIDAACELIDFFRFNVHFAEKLAMEQPLSVRGIWNKSELRPLDGFVYAVTPFNFTSIAGNLPTAPALMGNTVIWKPSQLSPLAAHFIMELLAEAGLPPGVVNLVTGKSEQVTRVVLSSPHFAGFHFTGSTAVMQGLWKAISNNLESYRSYPRIVGETGGKDFIFAHASADLDALAVAIARGGYEYQGQKCSAASRIFVPKSLWPKLEAKLEAILGEMKMGDPLAPGVFMGAVISKTAFDDISGYVKLAKDSSDCRIVAGGGSDDSEGYFIEPTLVETTNPKHRLMREEIFGPVVTAFVYEDDRFEEALTLCDEGSPYGLTGAVFANDRVAVEHVTKRLRGTAGNFYVNDKPTGAVVGQQPFGGGRLSGTNDKAGSAWNLMRWAQPRSIKENLSPPRDWKYPYMG